MIERIENAVDSIGRKKAIDRRLALRNGPVIRRLCEGREHCVDGYRSGQAIDHRIELRGGDAVRGYTG